MFNLIEGLIALPSRSPSTLTQQSPAIDIVSLAAAVGSFFRRSGSKLTRLFVRES